MNKIKKELFLYCVEIVAKQNTRLVDAILHGADGTKLELKNVAGNLSLLAGKKIKLTLKEVESDL